MSTELFSEQTEAAAEARQGRLPPETAPSLVRPDEPKLARLVALVSVSALVLAGFILLIHWQGRTTLFGPTWGPILAWLFMVSGVGGLLFHAARDGEQQVRRIYM